MHRWCPILPIDQQEFQADKSCIVYLQTIVIKYRKNISVKLTLLQIRNQELSSITLFLNSLFLFCYDEYPYHGYHHQLQMVFLQCFQVKWKFHNDQTSSSLNHDKSNSRVEILKIKFLHVDLLQLFCVIFFKKVISLYTTNSITLIMIIFAIKS